ncbi:hypothetical protein R1sor_014251 [Riccia sorocarpa]|uniref:Uncharacterized protein n=1 Tax=Riccia sorocarpa TaxID=122646 RepID=A0ABD3HBW6_9MARC
MERGILSFYSEGNPAIGPFRNWVVANWAKKLRVTLESVQESGQRGFLTMMKTRQDRDTVLTHVHAHIRGCVVAHMAWIPQMDVTGYVAKPKPLENNVTAKILWDKEKPLPDSVIITLAGCDFKCPLRKVEEGKPIQEGDDSESDAEQADGLQPKHDATTNGSHEGERRCSSEQQNTNHVNSEVQLTDTA